MRVLSAISLIVAFCGCSDNGRDTAISGRPSGTAVKVKRSDRDLVLDAVLYDILNNPDLKSERELYGAAGDRRIALVTNRDYGIPWPGAYQPLLPGWTAIRIEEGAKRDLDQKRLLGVRIDKYAEQDGKRGGLFDAPIEMTILNAGGDKNGAVIGGCSVSYRPKQVGGKWGVQFAAFRDP